MPSSFFRSLLLPLEAMTLLRHHRQLRRWAMIPIALNALIYVLFLSLAIYLLDQWEMPDWWVPASLMWAAKWFIGLAVILFLTYYSFVFVGMLVASPFHEKLSDQTQATIGPINATTKKRWTQHIYLQWESIARLLRLLCLQGLATLVCLPLLLIPIIGWLPMLLCNAYFVGLEMTDIAMSCHQWRTAQRRQWIQKNRPAIFSLGLICQLLFFIPFIGLFMLSIGVISGGLLLAKTSPSKAARPSPPLPH